MRATAKKTQRLVPSVGLIWIVTIDELVKKELLNKVKVQRPADVVIEAGNQKSMAVFNDIMRGLRRCASNSICVVEAMREKGEDDWFIVGGFAFEPEIKNHVAHVWVRKGPLHYDPTWIRWDWNPEDLAYYQVLQPLKAGPRELKNDILRRFLQWEKGILAELKNLSSGWELKLPE